LIDQGVRKYSDAAEERTPAIRFESQDARTAVSL